jgi:hypothetical protein
MSKTRIAKVAFVLALAVNGFAGDLDFVRENIYVSLRLPDTMCVKGEYFFATKIGSAIKTSVVYPFPVDSSLDFPHAIHVFDKTGTLTYQSHPEQAMVLIPISINKADTSKITVVYRQRLKRNTGRYILTTTQSWEKPLGRSNYSITVPQNVTLEYFSYESDSVFNKKDSLVYFFSKENFMPIKDLVFRFKVP